MIPRTSVITPISSDISHVLATIAFCHIAGWSSEEGGCAPACSACMYLTCPGSRTIQRAACPTDDAVQILRPEREPCITRHGCISQVPVLATAVVGTSPGTVTSNAVVRGGCTISES